MLDGRPVTVRLLDPPLHEFLPHPEAMPAGLSRAAPRRAAAGVQPDAGNARRAPGLLLHPRLYEMQVRSLLEAARQVPGSDVEVMIPLVAYERELELARELIERSPPSWASSTSAWAR